MLVVWRSCSTQQKDLVRASAQRQAVWAGLQPAAQLVKARRHAYEQVAQDGRGVAQANATAVVVDREVLAGTILAGG